jgi:hypothetical protein
MADQLPPEKGRDGAGTPGGAADSQTPPPEPETVEALKAKLAKSNADLAAANHEAAERRKKLDAFEKTEADRQQAALTETERLKKEVAAEKERAEAAIREKQEQAVKSEAVRLAAGLSFNPDLTSDELLAFVGGPAKFIAADGAVTGLQEALAALSKAKPYLLKQATPPQLPPMNPGGAAGQAGQETVEQRRKRLGLGR